MPLVQSLVDVIQKGHTPEDHCTNALVWLLQRCSPNIACEMLALAGLPLKSAERIDCQIQLNLSDSRPDAVIEFPGHLYVVVETKIHSGMCNPSQLRNHLRGAVRHFRSGCTKVLFLSVERLAPKEVRRLAEHHPEQIFFLSWQEVLLFLESKRAVLDHEQQVYLEEFFACIRAEKLWRLFPMTTDELKAYLEHYPDIWTKRSAAENLLNRLLEFACTQAVSASGEYADSTEADDDSWENLPCLYAALKIKGWHTTSSAYLFINAPLRKIGIVLTGYQYDRKQKEQFLSRWHGSFKNAFAADPRARTFIWEEDDEIAGDDKGYFKAIDGTSGQVFDPSKIEAFSDYFYWGYWHDLDVSDTAKAAQSIADDFKKLLANYGPGHNITAKKLSGKAAKSVSAGGLTIHSRRHGSRPRATRSSSRTSLKNGRDLLGRTDRFKSGRPIRSR